MLVFSQKMLAPIPAAFCECVPILQEVQNIVGQMEESIKTVQVDIPEKMSMEILNLRTALDSLELPTEQPTDQEQEQEPAPAPKPVKLSEDHRLQLEHAERNLGKKLSSLFEKQFSELKQSYDERLAKISHTKNTPCPHSDISSQIAAIEKSVAEDSASFEEKIKQLADKAAEELMKSKYSDASSKVQALELTVGQRKRDLLLLQQEVSKITSQISKRNTKAAQIVQPQKRKKDKQKKPLLSHEELMYNAQRERLISYQREWFAVKSAISQIIFDVESQIAACSEKLGRVEKAVAKAQTVTETTWRMEDRREQILTEARQFAAKKTADIASKTDREEINAFSDEMTSLFAQISEEVRESEQAVSDLSKRIPR